MKAITLQDYKQRMLPVLVHIQQQLDEPLALDALARLAHFSPFHFHRVFRGMLGESLQAHIRRLRLERAATRLKRGDHPVTRIAFEAGYDTHEAFTRAFRAAFGLAPSQYRLRHRPPLTSPSAPSGVHYQEGWPPRRFRAVRPRSGAPPVTVRRLPEQRVAFVRHLGPYAQCGAAWDTLSTWLGKEGHLGGDTSFLGICHDDPEVTPPERLRYDACVTVDGSFRPRGGIGVQSVAGGDYAVTTHQGPYAGLGRTYVRLLGQWLPRSGRELGATPCLEFYLNDPNSTAPKDLLTEVRIPLAR